MKEMRKPEQNLIKKWISGSDFIRIKKVQSWERSKMVSLHE